MNEYPIVTVPSDITVSEVDTDARLIELFLNRGVAANTVSAYHQDIAVFMVWRNETYVYDKSLAKITFRSATDFVQHVRNTSSEATAARRVTTMRNLYKFGIAIGYLRWNPFSAIKTPSVRNKLADRILTEDQVVAVLDAAGRVRDQCVPGYEAQGKRDYALAKFLYVTGCRISEALELRWTDFRHDDGMVFVTVYGKGGKTRVVKIPNRQESDLYGDVLRGVTVGDCQWVFHTNTGNPMHKTQAQKLFARISDEVGFKVTPHYLRHSHATHALRNGADIVTVRDSLGHGSLQVTSQYLHVRPDDASSDYINIPTGEGQ
jgi:integrase/recombinase XerD